MTAWYLQQAQPIDQVATAAAINYQQTLTKPAGSLGRLEQLAVRFSGFQATIKPAINDVFIAIMAADHGVADEGVSAFPQSVTAQMLQNFAAGGAAICVLAEQMQAQLAVVNVGTVSAIEGSPSILDRRIAAGTKNFCLGSAMNSIDCEKALAVGQELAQMADAENSDLFIGGEMGIANTTSAACLAARLMNLSAEQVAGPGTGVDDQQLLHKKAVIAKALARHECQQALDILASFGGFEIAALVGAYIACAQRAIPVLLDGYISTAAALVAVGMNPSIRPWLIASHLSAEPAHKAMLESLDLQPLLDLDMRLGEGSGAAVAVPLLRSACCLQAQMASFAEANVSDKI